MKIEMDMERLAADMEARMSALADDLNTTLRDAGLSAAEVERMTERMRHANERTMDHVRHKVERAQRRAERHQHRAHGWHWAGGWSSAGPSRPDAPPPSPRPPVPPAPVTTDEREAVLRMLSERKITADEAQRLLAALEGR